MVLLIELFPNASFDEIGHMTSIMIFPFVLIYIRELFILPKLVKKTNKRIELYNTYWFGK